MIVVGIPLLDSENFYALFGILNFPLPLPMRSGLSINCRWSAKFEQEMEMTAVNKSGTGCILLSQAEATWCCASTSKLCQAM